MDTIRPLFLPLRKKWYLAFKNGLKRHEYRALGPRWNETTCRVGRTVVLSMGYGKHSRLSGKILSFRGIPISQAPSEALEIYPNESHIAVIEIALEPNAIDQPVQSALFGP